jgi:hypothetical protein
MFEITEIDSREPFILISPKVPYSPLLIKCAVLRKGKVQIQDGIECFSLLRLNMEENTSNTILGHLRVECDLLVSKSWFNSTVVRLLSLQSESGICGFSRQLLEAISTDSLGNAVPILFGKEPVK